VLQELTGALTGGQTIYIEGGSSQGAAQAITSKCVVLTDNSNLDAVAAGLCLKHYLTISGLVETPPHIVQEGDEPNDQVNELLMFCTAGALSKRKFLGFPLKALDMNKFVKVVPIVAEDNFKFPHAETLRTLSSDASVQEAYDGQAAATVAEIFKEIAAVFKANADSESVLKTNAQQVALRLETHWSDVPPISVHTV
jgi:hypothetical protein